MVSLQNAAMWGRIYMDYAGATPTNTGALRAFEKALSAWANPGALHAEGIQAKESLDKAREKIARIFECKDHEIIFTSGGTEGNNLAIVGAVEASLIKRNMSSVHIVTTTIEHASVLEPIKVLETAGARVTRLTPDPTGRITPRMVLSALTPSTVFISIGWANGEIGVIQPIHAIAKAVKGYDKDRAHKIVFHSDAGQAPLYLPSTISGLGVDILTLDAGKLYGPRGGGALYIRKGVTLAPLMRGGGQEKGVRPGTENVALAHGLAAALEDARSRKKEEADRLFMVRKECIALIKQTFPDAVVNGNSEHTLPHILNISIPTIDPEYVVLRMDKLGVAIATKSACEEGEKESHVVGSLVGEEDGWRAKTTLRFSFGEDTTLRKIKKSVQVLAEAVRLSRSVAILSN